MTKDDVKDEIRRLLQRTIGTKVILIAIVAEEDASNAALMHTLQTDEIAGNFLAGMATHLVRSDA